MVFAFSTIRIHSPLRQILKKSTIGDADRFKPSWVLYCETNKAIFPGMPGWSSKMIVQSLRICQRKSVTWVTEPSSSRPLNILVLPSFRKLPKINARTN